MSASARQPDGSHRLFTDATVARPTKFLLLAGSERPEGNTDQVADWAQKYLWEQHGVLLEIRHIRGYEIAKTGSCGDCNNAAIACPIDDGARKLTNEMAQADGIIWAAPVHGFGVASPMQQFIERAGVGHLRHLRPLTNKVAGFIITSNRYSGEAVFDIFMRNAILNRMIIAGWGMTPVLQGRNPGDALKDKDGMVAVATMLDRMVEVSGIMRAAEERAGKQEHVNERELMSAGVKTGSLTVSPPDGARVLEMAI